MEKESYNETLLSNIDKELANINLDLNGIISNATVESMSGTDSIIVLEFPTYKSKNNLSSVYVKMNSITTLSYSVHRAKIPMTPLGQTTVAGFGLGTKTVAGHLIKNLFYTDELTEAISIFSKLSLKEKNSTYTSNYGSKFSISFDERYQITQKDFDSLMKDDITPFNIHSISISEYTGKMVRDTIYGCTIINSGQVRSVDNLTTENTIAFMGKSVEENKDVNENLPSFPNASEVMTLSRLLRESKK